MSGAILVPAHHNIRKFSDGRIMTSNVTDKKGNKSLYRMIVIIAMVIACGYFGYRLNKALSINPYIKQYEYWGGESYDRDSTIRPKARLPMLESQETPSLQSMEDC